ncbi:hypothetical protein EIL87_24580 [Saccharopolyspora rhizosphaerae]|uniref:Uncharacterized protein n=1 Tax=Saccharopolyspora rhizosphaerae TaxID=2492662 RepID=A0A3R8NYX6_9PSEU|nr:DUF6350 family protein [Saccharopolyspora rhizosphaerae]RRO12858.1 hypothetical protein EIL87_24580 [Saccharopolyspora rhizosphaerae]
MSALDPNPHATATGHPDRKQGLRRWLFIAVVSAVPLICFLAVAVLLALVVGAASGASLDPLVVLAAALPGWLALYQSPLVIAGAPLSVLPMLPTIGAVLLVASASAFVARRCRLRRPDQAFPVIATMGLVHASVGAVFALLLDGPFSAVPVEAFLSCGLTAAIAATAGVANRCGLFYLLWERTDAYVWTGLRIGLLTIAIVLAVGAGVLLAAIAVSAPEMVASMERMGGGGDAVGATVLTLLYLPNAVVAGWAFAAGSGFSIGSQVVQPLQHTSGPLPDLPLLAVLPGDGPAVWWSASLLLPLLVGMVVGLVARRVPGPLGRRLVVVLVAAGVAALAVLVLAVVAGGRLGNGPVGDVSFHPVALALATLCWLAIPALAMTWLGGAEEPDDPALSTFATDEFQEAEDIDPVPETEADDEDFAYTDLDELIAEIPVARSESDSDPEVAAEEFDAEPDGEEPAPRDRR